MSEVRERVRNRMVAHGCPAGLLPDCIVSDEYNETTGAFTVNLARKVDRKIDGFPAPPFQAPSPRTRAMKRS